MITQSEMAVDLLRSARRRDPHMARDELVALVEPILKRHDQQSYTVHESEILHRKLHDAMEARRAPKAVTATKAAPVAATKAAPAPQKAAGDSWSLIAELRQLNEAAAELRATRPTTKAAAAGENTIVIHRDAHHPRVEILVRGQATLGRKSQ